MFAVEIYLISGYIIGILLLAIVLLLLIIYIGKAQVSRDKKDSQLSDARDKIDELQITIAEMTENGVLLQERANEFAEYYTYADKFVRDIFSTYSTYKQTGIDNVLKHRYYGDDPTIQHFIKETLIFDKNTIIKMEEYNRNVQQIFNETKEEE